MAIVTKSSEVDPRLATLTDAVTAFSADGYTTGTDPIPSEVFPLGDMLGQTVTVVSTIVQAANGTSAHHLTPVVQISLNGTTFVDHKVLELSSSTAVTAAHSWTWFLDLTTVTAMYMKIWYIIHTSAHAVLADATTGTVKTQICVKK